MILYRNLDHLKARLLPSDMADLADFDIDLEAIGLGVAAAFDTFTGRELRRNTAASFECPAGVESVVIRSYPIEAVTSVSLVSNTTATTVTDSLAGLHNAAGIIDFGGPLGSHLDRLLILSSGGYWCDQGDGEDLPANASELPSDLLEAWILQCRAVADASGLFRQKGAANLADKDKRDPALRLDTLDLLPAVKRILARYQRLP